jgi:hypothetical protein
VATSRAGVDSFEQEKPRESLSQFAAKILDQLSVSAWLPAGALVLGVLPITNIRIVDGDVTGVFTRIANISFSGLVLLLFSIVLATMLTQAFGYSAIRLLEGYWGEGLLRSLLLELGCRRHASLRRRLDHRRDGLERQAFNAARIKMLSMGWTRRQLDVLEYDLFGLGGFERDDMPSDQEREEAHELPWRDYADGAVMRRIEALDRKLYEYPEVERRIMPTLLGNVVRAAEDRAYRSSEGNLTGWIMRLFHRLPVALQSEHDEHRNRLDLYATLVLLSLLLAVVAVLALHHLELVLGWSLGLSFISTWINYQAALASARGYGTVLQTVSEWEREQEALRGEGEVEPTEG